MNKSFKHLFSKANHYLNYLYYLSSSILKNTYPYKLISLKYNPHNSEASVLYKIRGESINHEIALKSLLNNKNMIERFKPVEAAKLGCLALEEIFLKSENAENIADFHHIKSMMLNSTHDAYPSEPYKKLTLCTEILTKTDQGSVDNETCFVKGSTLNNKYMFKLVGHKLASLNFETIILFTILGRREGHEKSLNRIMTDGKVLSKFHPTEALKFGFIYAGDAIFALPAKARIERLSMLKDELEAI